MDGLRTLLDGRGLVESPRWHSGRLYFCDWSSGEVLGLSRRRTWADLGESAPDGICVDAENAVWYAEVPGRRCARVAEGGAELATVPLDRGGFACALGGPAGTTLFITAAEWRGMTDARMVTPGSGRVLAVDVAVPGAGWP
jgi:sugar lactone lactonase YvrE